MHRMRLAVGAVGVAAMAMLGLGTAQAQAPSAKTAAASKHVIVAADDLKWGPPPPSLPAGSEVAVLDGDPAKAGLFTLRAKLPDGYTVPPHAHPTDEHLTIISGTLMVGLGDKLDGGSMHGLSTGAYTRMPAATNHYVRAKGATVIQVTAMGPFDIKYVNPDDDPRKKSSPQK